MNETFLAKQGYKATQKETASDKSIELRVFMSVTAQLKAVDADNKLEFPQLVEATLENLKLWKIVFIDLVSTENTLPLELKKSLIELATFSQTHSRKVLRGEAKPDVLIDINTSIIAGLRQSMMLGVQKTAPAEQSKMAEVA